MSAIIDAAIDLTVKRMLEHQTREAKAEKGPTQDELRAEFRDTLKRATDIMEAKAAWVAKHGEDSFNRQWYLYVMRGG